MIIIWQNSELGDLFIPIKDKIFQSGAAQGSALPYKKKFRYYPIAYTKLKFDDIKNFLYPVDVAVIVAQYKHLI